MDSSNIEMATTKTCNNDISEEDNTRGTCGAEARKQYLEYSQETSCHGIGHVSDKSRGLARRSVTPSWICVLKNLNMIKMAEN